MIRTSVVSVSLEPDPGKRAVLEHAQQFHLDGERHVADFIEKQGAAVGLFEAAGAAGDGAGERAFFVAEQFAFQQIFRDRAAVDGDHLLLAARAVFVHRLGDEFLAGAAFAGDQDRRVGAGDAADQFENFLQRAGNADHFHPAVVFRQFGGRLIGAAAVLLGLQRGFHDRPQLEGQRFLAQHIVRAALGGLDDLAGGREIRR